MLGKWDGWYKDVKEMSSFRYGDTVTYKLAADFLADMDEVEDWGCGTGGFKRFFKGKYVGVDGSKTPFVDKVADLREYRTSVDGIMMRHVLEHNNDWKKVLTNALASFNKKFCFIIFTPFSNGETKILKENLKYGVDVPDISFAKEELEKYLTGITWRMKTHKTKTGYGVEHIYYVEKPLPSLPKIAVISASLGSYDKVTSYVAQSIAYDNFLFTDDNFPPRFNAMTPRLQAKIPKFFGWQMVPGYDYYLWLDGSFSLPHIDSVKYFYEMCRGYDIVVFKHNKRPDIRQEARYIRKGIKQAGKNLGSKYIIARYQNELLAEQMMEIERDKSFKDDLLLTGGVFMYKNTPEVQKMFKEWWYHVSRYIVEDQISFPYVLKKNGLKINVLPLVFSESPYLYYESHRADSK